MTLGACLSASLATCRDRFGSSKGGALEMNMTSECMQCCFVHTSFVSKVEPTFCSAQHQTFPVTQVGWVDRACMNLARRLKASAVRRGVNDTISKHRGCKVSRHDKAIRLNHTLEVLWYQAFCGPPGVISSRSRLKHSLLHDREHSGRKRGKMLGREVHYQPGWTNKMRLLLSRSHISAEKC
jgi:hypothetical protein